MLRAFIRTRTRVREAAFSPGIGGVGIGDNYRFSSRSGQARNEGGIDRRIGGNGKEKWPRIFRLDEWEDKYAIQIDELPFRGGCL